MAATFRTPPSPPELIDAPLRPLNLLQYEKSTAKAVLPIPPAMAPNFISFCEKPPRLKQSSAIHHLFDGACPH